MIFLWQVSQLIVVNTHASQVICQLMYECELEPSILLFQNTILTVREILVPVKLVDISFEPAHQEDLDGEAVCHQHVVAVLTARLG